MTWPGSLDYTKSKLWLRAKCPEKGRDIAKPAFHAVSTFVAPSSAHSAVVSELQGNFDELIQ